MLYHSYLELHQYIHNLEDRQHLFATIAYSVAPTTEGVKPSTLLNFGKHNRNLFKLWLRYKDEVTDALDLSYYELKQTQDNIFVLFYRPQQLEQCINQEHNMNFLKREGYHEGMGLDKCLDCLRDRYSLECPHEIGIFLGIPPMDIISFIEKNGEDCLMCKYWKVYHNQSDAKRIFDEYDSAKARMAQRIICQNMICQ